MVYRDGDKWIYNTGECPKRLPNVKICFEGTTPDSISEVPYADNQLAKMQVIEDVPPEWRKAFGMPELEPEPVEEKPKTKRKRRPTKQTVQDFYDDVDEDFEDEFEDDVYDEPELIEDDWRETVKYVWHELWGENFELKLLVFPLMIFPTLITIAWTILIWLEEEVCKKPLNFSDQPERQA